MCSREQNGDGGSGGWVGAGFLGESGVGGAALAGVVAGGADPEVAAVGGGDGVDE